MTRKFLEDLGIEKEVIDKILDENSADIGKEIGKTKTAQEELARVRGELKTANDSLEEMKKSNGDTAELQRQLTELQSKYDTDTGALQKQITDRDYTDAISKAISGANEGKGLKFSSKSAQSAFISALREKGLALKDGDIDGFDDFVKAQKEADPDAFAGDTPPARFTSRIGAGGPPPAKESIGAMYAKQFNAQYAQTKKE